MMLFSKFTWVPMIRSVVRMFLFLAFRVLIVLMQWSAMISAFSQTSSLFKEYGFGQTPVVGMRLLANLTARSVLECGRLCLNNGSNAGCGGFLYRTQSCNGNSPSSKQPAGCQLLRFSDVNSLSFEPANTNCPWHFYFATTAASRLLPPPILGTEVVVAVTTSSNGQLFVTGLPKTSNQISVYYTATLTLRDRMTVLGADGFLMGLAVSSDNNYLFIADFVSSRLLKVNLSSSSIVADWAVAEGPRALSINSLQNILVASSLETLQEFAPNGSLVREVPTFDVTFHAVEVSKDIWIVSFFASNQIWWMAANGSALSTYVPSSPFSPCCLGVNKQGFVFVADKDNDRVIVVHPVLKIARPLPLAGNISVVKPMAMYLDSTTDYLYVGEYDSPYRVIVTDVSDVSSLF